jgi:hypothetical protein
VHLRVFREKNGDPPFHSERGKQRAPHPPDVTIHGENGVICLPKAGWVRAVWSRRVPGTVKTVTVRRVPSGRSFASVLVEGESAVVDPVPQTAERAAGVDLTDFAVLTAVGKTRTAFSQEGPGETHREKIRRPIARRHECGQVVLRARSTDRRRHFDTVCRDDLNVVGMVHNRTLARGMAQSGRVGVQRGPVWQVYPGAGPIRATFTLADRIGTGPMRAAPGSRRGGRPQQHTLRVCETRPVWQGSARQWATGPGGPQKPWRDNAGTGCREGSGIPGLSGGEDVKNNNLVATKTKMEMRSDFVWAND